MLCTYIYREVSVVLFVDIYENGKHIYLYNKEKLLIYIFKENIQLFVINFLTLFYVDYCFKARKHVCSWKYIVAFFSTYFYKFFEVINTYRINLWMMGEGYISINHNGKNRRRKFSNQRKAITVWDNSLTNVFLMFGDGKKIPIDFSDFQKIYTIFFRL